MRVANELGAGNGKGAKFATIVAVTTSIVIGLFFWLLIIFFHNELALIFSSSEPVLKAVNKLSILLAFTVLLNSVQPVLSGKLLSSYLWFLLNLMNLYEKSICMHLYNIRISWTGVAVGSGWQSYVAYINLGCYYLIGVPLGFLMGWGFHQGVMVRNFAKFRFQFMLSWYVLTLLHMDMIRVSGLVWSLEELHCRPWYWPSLPFGVTGKRR